MLISLFIYLPNNTLTADAARINNFGSVVIYAHNSFSVKKTSA